MGATLSLIPELEDVVQHGSPEKRVETLQRITALFLDGASRYNDEHVDLFDDVFGLLIEEIETKARAELSDHLAPVSNAPVEGAAHARQRRRHRRRRAGAQAGAAAGEADLIDVARTKSQAHLQAISARRALGEAVTDVLVRRGDREVARRVADNRGARISENGFYRLVKRAEEDGILAEKVGLRPDIPAPMFRDLLTKATAVVHKRLLASATPEVRAAICDVLAKVAKEVGARVGPRDYRAAQRVVLKSGSGRPNERGGAGRVLQRRQIRRDGGGACRARQGADQRGRPADGRRSARSGADPVQGGRPGLADGEGAHPGASGRQRTSTQGLDAAFANYGRLSASTAQRVVRFWQVRQNQ